MNNQEHKKRPHIVIIKSNEPLLYPYSVKINKCSGSWNNINDTYAKCVSDVIKDINIKVFSLMFWCY